MKLDDKIFIAGHKGMVGSSIVRQLKRKGFSNLLLSSHQDLDLTNQHQVENFFKNERPKFVILAAAKVGGIHANETYPADFIYQNMMIQFNVIHSSFKNHVERLLFLGSTCIYPKNAEQPMVESELLAGKLEPTNEPYAIAKIAGIKLCESYNRQYGTDYRSVMPSNLYGINDNFHSENSHVIPGLINRFHKAKTNNDDEVCVWGSGKVMREFLYVDDMAEASLFVLELEKEIYESNVNSMLSHINVGSGKEISINDLAQIIKEVTGFRGKLSFDTSKPDGPARKLSDISRLSNMGWSHSVNLKEGLEMTYKWYLSENV